MNLLIPRHTSSQRSGAASSKRTMPPCEQIPRATGSSGQRLNLSLNGYQAAQDANCYGFCPASSAELGQNRADVELHGVF
jgi:hypothetical protein